MTRAWLAALVFGLALLHLGWNVGHVGLAETYIDPIAKIPAQDEAVYASTALDMAASNHWLTPRFLNRYALYKPPLLFWVTASAIKLSGTSLWSLRAPSLLAGATIVTILFLWIWRVHNLWAASAVSGMLVSDRLFHVLARLTLTDMPVVLCIVVAMFSLHRDPGLTRRASVWIIGIAVGAAILAKSVAGLLPLMMLAASGVGFRRFLQVCGVGALVAAPWHVYQLVAHTRWFWAEYILTENFTWAVAAPEQSTSENQLAYYGTRLWSSDPVLVIAALLGIPVAIRERNRQLAAWIGVVLFAFVAFGYRNTSYLLLLIPALALLAAGAVRRPAMALVATALALAGGTKLPYSAEHPMPSVAALKAYAGLHRLCDLVIVAPDDEFVSSTIPLFHVRYAFFEPEQKPYRLPLDFRYLGVTVTVPEFEDLTRWLPIWTRRMDEFGLRPPLPYATVILLRTTDDIRSLIAARPNTDFSLPAQFSGLADARHILTPGSTGRVFAYHR